MIGPMPGMLASWRLAHRGDGTPKISFSSASIFSLASSILRRHQPQRRARELGQRRAFLDSSRARSFEKFPLPWPATTPNSTKWPRSALISIVRCRTSRSRVRCSRSTPWLSALFTGTNCICGRPTASQIAAASAASFFRPALYIGLHMSRRQKANLVPQGANLPAQ